MAASSERRSAPANPTSSSARSRRPGRSSGIGARISRSTAAVAATLLARAWPWRRPAADAGHGLGDQRVVGRRGAAGGMVQIADRGAAQFSVLAVRPRPRSAARKAATSAPEAGRGGRPCWSHQAHQARTAGAVGGRVFSALARRLQARADEPRGGERAVVLRRLGVGHRVEPGGDSVRRAAERGVVRRRHDRPPG